LIAWFSTVKLKLVRVGVEAGPLSQWLYPELKKAGLAVELLETRHVRTAFKTDRKSTRLNSSHLVISYAVFCLKKKKTNTYMACRFAHTTLIVTSNASERLNSTTSLPPNPNASSTGAPYSAPPPS